ncbi:hypothetical protein SAMN05216577_106147 [Pseudomonas citronellolis]|uniref:Uncharacterized protein n=1 Tax=Pseudomonas citronellolis TaxID=53408 RepID=A0AAQ1HLF3_9PSED|nr:hypothetical protein [Pseudomonas citronellolis]TGC24232.1 hypothetical protein CW310_22970 [Pseudomonas citronellolis]SFC50059.1 hypothetical protein SAMN05216577_106147 [Pseudomonas citronellolis]
MSTIESIADDGIEHARYCREQASWLHAISVSISEALSDGKAALETRVERAKTLAGLANYLTYDLMTYSDQRAADMDRELAAAAQPVEKGDME